MKVGVNHTSIGISGIGIALDALVSKVTCVRARPKINEGFPHGLNGLDGLDTRFSA